MFRPPVVLSPEGMLGLRGFGGTGLGIVSTARRTGSTARATARAGTTASSAASAAAPAGGFKAKPLAPNDKGLLRNAPDEAAFCTSLPTAPGLRPKTCKIIDNAAVRFLTDGNDGPAVLKYLREKHVTEVPYDIYLGSPGSMTADYGALFTLARYPTLPKSDAPNASQAAIPMTDLATVLEDTGGEARAFYDIKTVETKLYQSLANQQLAYESAQRQAEGKATEETIRQQSADELAKKIEKDDEARKQETAKADAFRTQILIGGGVVAAAVVIFLVVKSR